VGAFDIVVYGLCTNVSPNPIGSTIAVDELKIMKRVRKIEQVVRAFHDTGVPADHIFLVGQSAGGWASLLVARRQQVPINAVIAFAPAFAGQKAKRPDDMQTVQELHIAFLSAAERLNALVFAFDDDPYNTPEDLAVLRAIPGIRFIRLPADVIAGRRCERANAHATAFRDCFAQTQMDVILTYIAERVTIGNQ
jgi:dienelactone hydrolase